MGGTDLFGAAWGRKIHTSILSSEG